MCGIAGQFGIEELCATKQMITQLSHRGPDGQGVNTLATGSLGHTRLAILDIAGGHQPICCQNYWISFNGEIYNHAELRATYLGKHDFQTHTDTEVVLRLYIEFGDRCVEMLDGMFAFAIIHEDSLFLARDPIGVKPLYVGMKNGTIYFASEIKALAEATDNICEFPAGHCFHTQTGLRQYYRLGQQQDQNQETGPPFSSQTQASHTIHDSVHKAVIKRMMADVPVGVSLSGGLDSSIVAAVARQVNDQLMTFAIGVEGSPDLEAAQKVATYLGTRHHARTFTQQEMQQVLPEVIYYLESFDPALVRSALPNYLLAKLAAEEVKVILTGEGADELYAGYSYLKLFTKAEELDNELRHITRALHNTNLQRADRMAMAYGIEARVPFLDTDSIALAFSLPPDWKLCNDGQVEKQLLRNAFADELPHEIVKRPKLKFSAGAGSSHLLAQIAEDTISTTEFINERQRLSQEWNYHLPNKEALYYYRILHDAYQDEWIFPSLGQSHSL